MTLSGLLASYPLSRSIHFNLLWFACFIVSRGCTFVDTEGSTPLLVEEASADCSYFQKNGNRTEVSVNMTLSDISWCVSKS